MPLDSADIVSDEVTAAQNMLAQLYRLRDEGKNLDETIAQVERQLQRAIDRELFRESADEPAED